MDASLVLTKPAPPPAPASSAPAQEPDSAQDDFAAHLPPEEAPRPPPRKPLARGALSEDETTTAADKKPEDKNCEDCATLTAPTGPVLVRPQSSVVTFDLSAIVAQGGCELTAIGAAAPSPAARAQTATPKPAADASAPTTTPTAGAAPVAAENAKAAPAETPPAATAALTPKALETIALPSIAPPPTDARPPPKLRAGRAEAATENASEIKSSPVTAAVAASPVKGAAKTETAFAIQSTTATVAANETSASTDAAPILDTAPAEHRAHKINETIGPAGHRATTPAALVAQHVIRRFDGKSTSIDVRLDPAELGRVRVSLEVGADNKVTALVAAENPGTLADLVRSARELERALQDAGLELSSGGLSFDLAERGDNAASDEKSSGAKGSGHSDSTLESAVSLPSRPFGLESWRGARVDVMV